MYATFERFEISMTLNEARSASHQGDCEADVIDLLKTAKIKRQLKKISAADLRSELYEYGAWSDEELQDREANEMRIVWLAAGNIVDEYYTQRSQKMEKRIKVDD